MHAKDIIDCIVKCVCCWSLNGFQFARICGKSLRFDEEAVEEMSHERLLIPVWLWYCCPPGTIDMFLSSGASRIPVTRVCCCWSTGDVPGSLDTWSNSPVLDTFEGGPDVNAKLEWQSAYWGLASRVCLPLVYWSVWKQETMLYDLILVTLTIQDWQDCSWGKY